MPFPEATTGTEDDRRMMDNLLAKLRAGDAEAAPRTRRRRRNHQKAEEEQSTISTPEEQVGGGNADNDDAQILAESLLKSLQSD